MTESPDALTVVPAPFDAARTWWERRATTPGHLSRSRLYHELAVLLRSGIGVREALARLRRQHSGRPLRLLEPLSEAVEQGLPLSPVLQRRTDLFSPLEAALIETGERSGRLDAAVDAVSVESEDAHRRSRRLLLSLAYPLFLYHFGVVIMPIGWIGIRKGWGAYVQFAGTAVIGFWVLFLLAISVHVALLPRPGYCDTLRRLPFLGRLREAAALGRFCRALGALHGAGITHDQALTLAARASDDSGVARDVVPRAGLVSQGVLLSDALAGSRAVPSELVSLISTGEHGGDLEDVMRRAADTYDERYDRAVKLVPPVLFVFGVLVIGCGVMAFALNVVSGITSLR